MQIICTGATGLVGYNTVLSALLRGHKVVAICGESEIPPMEGLERIHLDLTNQSAIERMVLDRFPDAIINCAAISSPAVVDKNPELAKQLNTNLPEKLGQLANHVGARLIHLSTDMVFDGKHAPYINTDIPAPFNLYGQTKLDAEKAVLKYAAHTSVVLRISHVCGRGLSQKRSFDEKLFLALSNGGKAVLAGNQTKRFVPVSHVADMLVELVERQNLSGIYHYAGSESLTIYEAGERICKHFGIDPEKFLERTDMPESTDLSLDSESLLAKVKTPAVNFERILDEIKVPDACLDWHKKQTGRSTIKRYKV